MNTKILQTLSSLLIKTANEKNISLQDEFGTREKFQQFVIAMAIKSVMEIGNLSLKDAYDFVLGSGEYQKLSDFVWESAQAQS
jgi:hypothetical protein